MQAHQAARGATGVHSLPNDLLLACLRPLTFRERWAVDRLTHVALAHEVPPPPPLMEAAPPPLTRSHVPFATGMRQRRWFASAGPLLLMLPSWWEP